MTEEQKTLPTSQEELEEIIAKAVKETEEKLVAKHNSDMASYRKSRDEEKAKAISEAVEKAKMSAEQLAKKEQEEQFELLKKENAEMSAKLKSATIKEKLIDNKLPLHLMNDCRLLGANESDLDSVIKVVSEELKSENLVSSKGMATPKSSQTNAGEIDFTALAKLR